MRGAFFAGFLLFYILSHSSSDSVYMPFKISVVDKLCQDVLHKGRYRAGIEAEPLLVRLDKMPW